MASKLGWTDDIESNSDIDFYLGPTYVSKRDKFGIVTSTSYTKNSKGEDIKVTKRIRITEKSIKKNKEIKTRENWPLFGDVDQLENFTQTEDVYFDMPKRGNRLFQGDDEDLDYLQDPIYLREKKELKLKIKDYKDELEFAQDASRRATDKRISKPIDRPERGHPNNKQEDCTVRVTNLSDYVNEQDIKDLFSKIGEVSRVYLARDKEKNNTKGFAFVTYTNSENAAKAISHLNRHGYDNLLLTVEWAKPSTREK